MPCYNYTSNDPIYFEPNIGIWSVERVYSVGQTYSYAAIARMCEIPDKDQLCVYTRAGVGSPETKLTLNINYTVNTSNETIVLINPPASGQVVVRRCTSNTKMLTTFSEGAKLTAQQLNLSTYQLLFLLQEKEFVGTTINEFYPIAITASAWSGATAYVVNNYVLSGGNIYRCIANNTNFQPPNATYWTLVNQASNGFVIEGGAGLSGPLKFNLNNITNGSGLIWNGSQFEAGFLTTTLDNLSDVVITNPSNNHILRYNGTTSTWVNALPTVDITLANPVFNSHIFVDEVNSYTNNNTSIPSSYAVPALNRFRDLNNKWNIPSILTTYHMLNVLTPGYTPGTSSTYFENFLSYINTTVNQFAGAIANPVKVKLFWNLNKLRSNMVDDGTSENLQDYRSMFWDSPDEFYHANMWTLVDNLKHHGVTNSGTVYWQNPYFAKVGNTYTSKLTGYGIKSKGFYLNVPECYTTSLVNLPIIKTNGTTETDHTFTTSSDLDYSKLNSQDDTVNVHYDTYLSGLRDMMSASVLSNLGTQATGTNVYKSEYHDARARYMKGWILSSDYTGWTDVNYKRLELNESTKSCLFKIPSQIIYYNKVALATANKTNAELLTANTNSSWPISQPTGSPPSGNTLSKTVRFTGPGKMKSGTSASESSLSDTNMGSLYKAERYWANWCDAWTSNPTKYMFSETDIEWQLKGVDWAATGLRLYDSNEWMPQTSLGNGAGVQSQSLYAAKQFPWPYRSTYWDKVNPTADGGIGTHLFNIDMNKFFSEAMNYIPDPRDEYVFRIVVKDSLLSTFKKAGSKDIASTIILEHGFSDNKNNGANISAISLAQDIYSKNNILSNSNRTKARLNRNDIKVFIQSEHLETFNSTEQYVINLCISVPRLKSIGYSRIFRTTFPSTGWIQTPEFDASGIIQNVADTEINFGPWSFNFGDQFNGAVGQATGSSTSVSNHYVANPGVSGLYGTYAGASETLEYNDPKAGRNECAVKFTRLGIPSDLWIRLSVLNTDGTSSFVTTSGGWDTNL